jgi:hypothetical protein
VVSIPKVVGVLACGCVLSLGLALQAPHIITGEAWRVEPSFYFVKQYDGALVRIHIDDTTQMTGRIGQGAHIEANVTREQHALSVRQIQ